jgi:hypothetical protein
MSFLMSCRNAFSAVAVLCVLASCEWFGSGNGGDTPPDTVPNGRGETGGQSTAAADSAFESERQLLARATLPPGVSPVVCGTGSGAMTPWTPIGPAGGILSLPGGHSLTVPANAVTSTRQFRLLEVPTPDVKVMAFVHPAGAFAQPTVTVTVSYSRCTGGERAESLWRQASDSTTTNVTGDNTGSAIISTPLSRLSSFALATN